MAKEKGDPGSQLIAGLFQYFVKQNIFGAQVFGSGLRLLMDLRDAVEKIK